MVDNFPKGLNHIHVKKQTNKTLYNQRLKMFNPNLFRTTFHEAKLSFK